MISGFLFICFRIFQILTLIPTLGMLAWFVHGYVSQNTLTPDFILILFIASVLGAAWAIATLVAYARARHSALFVAVVDLGFVGLFIAAVYELRGISNANCVSFERDSFYSTLGVVGYFGIQLNSEWSLHANKTCAMLKACFAFGIMNCIFFFVTFVSTPDSRNGFARCLPWPPAPRSAGSPSPPRRPRCCEAHHPRFAP